MIATMSDRTPRKRAPSSAVPQTLNPDSESFASTLADCGLTAAIYLALTLLMFSPVLPSISRAVIGPPEDNLVFTWNLWWGREAWRSPGESLSYTRHLLFPEGHSLLLHSMSWFNVGLGALLQGGLGLPLTYNVLILSTFVIGGVGAYLFAFERTQSRLGALLAGFVFAFNPLHFAQSLHHLNIASIQFLPWFVRSHSRSVERLTTRAALATAGWLALVTLCSWYFFVYAIVYLIADAAIRGLRERRASIPMLRQTAMELAGGCLLLAPLIVPMIPLFRAYSPPSGVAIPDPTEFNTADLLSFVWGNSYHPIWGAAESFIHKPFTGHTWEIAVPLGIANICLLALAVRSRANRVATSELPMLVVFCVLALGTQLRVLGASVGPPVLPYALLRSVPLLDSARVPPRAMVFGYLFLGLLVARGIQSLTARQNRRAFGGYATTLAAILAIGSLVEFWSVARSAAPYRAPAVYAQIPGDSGDFGILELPAGTHVGERAHMFYQTMHGIPIAGGFLARQTHGGVVDEMEDRLVRDLGAVLAHRRIRYIVVERRAEDPRLVAELGRQFRLIYSDESHDLLLVEPQPDTSTN